MPKQANKADTVHKRSIHVCRRNQCNSKTKTLKIRNYSGWIDVTARRKHRYQHSYYDSDKKDHVRRENRPYPARLRSLIT